MNSGFLRTLTSPPESDNNVGAKVERNVEALSDSSYISVGLPEEAIAVDAESENEQPRSCSSALPEQVGKTEYASEEHTPEPELPKTSGSKNSKKKKKERRLARQNSVDFPPEDPTE